VKGFAAGGIFDRVFSYFPGKDFILQDFTAIPIPKKQSHPHEADSPEAKSPIGTSTICETAL
jgi:hypothetical protein